MQPVLLFAVILLSPLVEGGLSYLLVTTIRLLLLSMVVIWVRNGLVAGRIKLPRTKLNRPIILFILLSLFLTLIVSPYKSMSTQWVMNILGYAILFYAVVLYAEDEKTRSRLIYAVILLGMLEAAYAIIHGVYLGTPRIEGTFSNPNHLAGYLAAISTFLLALILFENSQRRRLLVGVVLLLTLVTIVLSQSRGGFLALIAGFTFVLWFRYRMKALYLMAGVLVVVTIVPNPLSHRVKELPFTDIYAYSRIDIWKSGLAMVKDHPAGTGLGMYRYSSRPYAIPNEKAIAHYGKYAESAHNQYLHIVVEMGFIGLLIYLFGMAMMGREARDALVSSAGRERGPVIGFAGIMLATFVHGLVEANLRSPSITILLVLSGGFLATAGNQTARAKQEWEIALALKRYHIAFLAVLVVLTGIFVVKSAGAYYISVYADELRNKGAVDKAIDIYKYSILLDGWTARYSSELAGTYFVKYKQTGEARWAVAALDELNYAESLNPLDTAFPRYKARIYHILAANDRNDQIKQSQLLEALKSYKRAAEIDPYNPLNHHEIVKILLMQKNVPEAVERLKHLRDIEPNYLPGRIALAQAYVMLSEYNLAKMEYEAVLKMKSHYRNISFALDVEKQFLNVDEVRVQKELAVVVRRMTSTTRQFKSIYTR